MYTYIANKTQRIKGPQRSPDERKYTVRIQLKQKLSNIRF